MPSMTGSLPFLLCLHHHQPVGNFESVVEKITEQCYLPLLTAISNHPEIKITLHFSGSLLTFFESHYRGLIDTIGLLTDRGQAELLTGGFYEPILTLLREEDRMAQIMKLTDYLYSRFGVTPRGAWLAERVWEPGLASTLARAGVFYVALDDTHFKWAGLTDTYRPYLTEDQGFSLTLLPSDMTLRYLLPFKPVENLKDYLRSLQGKASWALMGDDGEKFGAWPGTHQWVYGQGWLEAFFKFLAKEPMVAPMTFGEGLEKIAPIGPVYIPPASYREMTEWALSPEQVSGYQKTFRAAGTEGESFVRGGLFRNFLSRYPEANLLHKRTLGVSSSLPAKGAEEAKDNLYKAQCNDAYWHGVFGGLYMFHLRESAWNHLLRAEELGGGLTNRWTALDLDQDGHQEFFYPGNPIGLVVSSHHGGTVVELDLRPPGRNLLNILSRRPEAYHQQLLENSETGPRVQSIHDLHRQLPEGVELVYDSYRRAFLMDHFLSPGANPAGLGLTESGDAGDFAAAPYSPSLTRRGLNLERKGTVSINGDRLELMLAKRLFIRDRGVQISYTLKPLSGRPGTWLFCPELPFSVMDGEYILDNENLFLFDGIFRISFPGATAAITPIKTVSQSESAMEAQPQGIIVYPQWELDLTPGHEISLSIILELTK